MARKASLKKNLSLQTAYEILSTCLPLITAPFLARTLGPEQLGIYSYTNANALYFIRLAKLGVAGHGTRTIASVRGNQELLDKKYSNIYFIQIMSTVVSLSLYILYLLFVCPNNKEIAALLMIPILGCFLNVNWLFVGLEKISFTVTRSFFVRITTVACILIFIRNPGDLWKYALIMASGTFISEFVIWVAASKATHFQKPNRQEIINNLKPIFILFIPVIATSIYHTMDKTMLGFMSTDAESGFYYSADKVINIPIAILAGTGTVMMPRITGLISSGRREQGNKLFLLAIEGIGAISIALSLGIAAVSKEFTPLFFGPGYERCVNLTIVLAPVLIIKSFASAMRAQYLIPNHKEKVYIKSVFTGAGVNLIANLLLIPHFGAMGAVVGTLVAELANCSFQYCYIRKQIPIGKTALNCGIYVVFGLIMIAAVRLVAAVLPFGDFINLILEIITGGIVYSSLCYVFWKKTKNVMYKEVFGTMINKLFARFKH